MTACLVTDEPISGWRLETIQHLRDGQPAKSPRWYCAMMRVRDGAIVGYESPAGVAQAVEGCARLAREADI